MKKEYADFLLKKVKEDYDEIAKDFSDSRYSVWEEFNIFKDYIKDGPSAMTSSGEVGRGERILDLGCGNGRLLDLFRDKNVEYTGIDNSEELIQIAKERSKIQNPKSKIQFLVADALNLPFEDNYFDKVFSVAVLHHIPSKEYRLQFLKEARRVLRPGGFLILSVWNLWRRPKTLKLLIKYGLLKITGLSKFDFKDIFVPWQNKILRYVHCFTKKELKNLAKEAGFKTEKIGIFRRGETKNYNIFLIAGK